MPELFALRVASGNGFGRFVLCGRRKRTRITMPERRADLGSSLDKCFAGKCRGKGGSG